MLRVKPGENGIAIIVSELVEHHGDGGRRVAYEFVDAIDRYIAACISVNIKRREGPSVEDEAVGLGIATDRVTRLRPALEASPIIREIRAKPVSGATAVISILHTDYISLAIQVV